MIEVNILIPVADNNGVQFTDAVHLQFETELVRLFSGYFGPSNPIPGAWRDATGTVYFDRNQPYTFSLPSITMGGLVKEAADFAKTNYAQLNVYIRYLGLSEIL